MKIMIPELDDTKVLRHVYLGDTTYRLLLWDTYQSGQKSRLGYAFYCPGSDVPLFVGEDFCASPLVSIDADDVLRSLLTFLTLQEGDTDAEYFAGYTAEQLAFARSEAEELHNWSMVEADEHGECYYKFVEIEETTCVRT